MESNDPCRRLSSGLRLVAPMLPPTWLVSFFRINGIGGNFNESVESFLSKPENFGGSWMIDGGWGGPPGPVVVRWDEAARCWDQLGYNHPGLWVGYVEAEATDET